MPRTLRAGRNPEFVFPKMEKKKLYNLLVSGNDGSWDGETYNFARSRFLEYTDKEISSRFETLNSSQIAALKALPCLFVYEGLASAAKVGWLKDVTVDRRNVGVTFVLDDRFAPIPILDVGGLEEMLGFERWERNRTHWAVKEVDLFKLLRELNHQTPLDEEPPTPGPSVVELPPEAPTVSATVDSVSTFVGSVLGLDSGGAQMFYRGHSNRSYKLAPTLFRKDEKGIPRHLESEQQMYRELMVSNSRDFHEDLNTLDRLVRMQHFGLPTRLLDITSNPLIALYFACAGGQASVKNGVHQEETQGEVVIFRIQPQRLKYFDSDTASCIANLARLTQAEKDAIDYEIEDTEKFNEQREMKRLLHFIKGEKPYFEPRILRSDLKSVICVKSKLSNDRISSQSGAFLLFGQEAEFLEDGMPDIGITVERVAVSSKTRILKELDQLNINESSVFPHIEKSARYIAGKFSRSD